MESQTKVEILRQHNANVRLNTPLPAPMRRAAADFSADASYSPLDERIIAAAADALDEGHTHYVDVPGIMPLRQALADFLNASTAASYEATNIIVTAGVQEARFLTIQKIGEDYESIAIPQVCHPGVQKALGVRPRKVVTLPADSARGYLPALESIRDAIAGGCRLLYLESPSRLSGAVYTSDEVSAIGAVLREHDAAAIWDQGLSGTVDGDYASLAAGEDAPARIAAIGDGWRGMGLGSWYIGYIAAPAGWIPAMQSQKQIMAICTSTAAQYAALAASQIYHEGHSARMHQLRQQRALALKAAQEAGIETVPGNELSTIALRPPAGAAEALARWRAAGYDAAPGGDFGAPDVIRLTVNEATAEALTALSQAPRG